MSEQLEQLKKRKEKLEKKIENEDFNKLVSKCIKVRKETKLEYYVRALKNTIKIKLGYTIE